METNKRLNLSAETGKLLTPANLAEDFGPRSAISKRCIAKLYDILRAGHPSLTSWKLRFGGILGVDWQRPAKALCSYAHKLGVECEDFNPGAFLFALQTYYAILLQLLVRRFPALKNTDFSLEPFSWRLWTKEAELAGEMACLSDATAEYHHGQVVQDASLSGDLLKALYQELFPRPLRHRLGEFYTPDWLARHMLDQISYTGDSKQRLLDPACGSGTFLLMAIQRIRAARLSSRCDGVPVHSKVELCRHILSHVVGMDLNPLAVMTARANYLIAIHGLLPLSEPWEIPIYLGDSILNAPPLVALRQGQFDFVVGNPPWIAWDNLPADYREATKPLWQHYGLFSLSGNEARHGGGKKDLSMLMLYAVADRYLKSGGRLGFVITQTLFQTKGAGDGFRRFRLGSDGEWLKVERVDDFVAVRPFDDAANWTSTVVIEKGRATQYPVPYIKWRTVDKKRVASPYLARPIDATRPGSPWLLQPEGFRIQMEELTGPSDYSAHLGANTGGANGVYWLELLGRENSGIRVRNLPQKGKADVGIVEAVIEPDLIYPLLQWRDIARYTARPSHHILLAQDCSARTGIDEIVMREKYPHTLEYLNHFGRCLNDRAAYRRYQQRRPFYSMYNVGPYTIAPIKVVWRRMDRRMNAAVVTSIDDPILGCRPVIPQETCVLIACDSLAEAQYLCAVLNSSLVNYLVQSHNVQGGKGFGTPNMLEHLNLRRFDPLNTMHMELAKCAETAHRKMKPEIENHVDRLIAELYGLDADKESLFLY
jgi:methylase of polypeptide subunit release factors